MSGMEAFPSVYSSLAKYTEGKASIQRVRMERSFCDRYLMRPIVAHNIQRSLKKTDNKFKPLLI